MVVCKFILLVFSGGDSLLFYLLIYLFTFLLSAKSVSFDGFPQNPSLFATFSENLRIRKHGSLHEKFLLLAKSMSFNGFFHKKKIRSDEGLTLETSAF